MYGRPISLPEAYFCRGLFSAGNWYPVGLTFEFLLRSHVSASLSRKNHASWLTFCWGILLRLLGFFWSIPSWFQTKTARKPYPWATTHTYKAYIRERKGKTLRSKGRAWFQVKFRCTFAQPGVVNERQQIKRSSRMRTDRWITLSELVPTAFVQNIIGHVPFRMLSRTTAFLHHWVKQQIVG